MRLRHARIVALTKKYAVLAGLLAVPVLLALGSQALTTAPGDPVVPEDPIRVPATLPEDPATAVEPPPAPTSADPTSVPPAVEAPAVEEPAVEAPAGDATTGGETAPAPVPAPAPPADDGGDDDGGGEDDDDTGSDTDD